MKTTAKTLFYLTLSLLNIVTFVWVVHLHDAQNMRDEKINEAWINTTSLCRILKCKEGFEWRQ